MFLSNLFVQNYATHHMHRPDNMFHIEARWRGLLEYTPPRKLARPLMYGQKLYFATAPIVSRLTY